MATSLPHKAPLIFEVMDPSINQHTIMVLMSSPLPMMFPDKPYGTPLAECGVPKKEADKFPGYTLVDFEKAPGMNELFWIFQNLDTAREWTTRTNSRENLTPAKYRGQITQIKTEQEVTPDTLPNALTGDLTVSMVEQTKNTGKAVLTEMEEVIAENAEPLVGQVAYAEKTIANTTELLVDEGTAADSGLMIIDSRVTPLGNGKSIKETTQAITWPLLSGSDWDDELNASVTFTEQMVAPGAAAAPYTSIRPVNQDRSLQHTEVVPFAQLESYHTTVPCRIDLPDIPRQLLAVNVIWNEQSSIGTQDFAFQKVASGDSWSLGTSADDQASSSCSISPEIQFRFRDVASSNLYGEEHEFYLKLPVTADKIRGKLGAKFWPVFKPESSTLTAVGQSIRISVSAQCSLSGTVEDNEVTEQGWSKGTSDDFAAGLTNNSIQIPPCIHGNINITGGTLRMRTVSATALIAMNHSIVGSITSTRTKTGTVTAQVFPTSIPAVSGPTKIPTGGLYIVDARVTSKPRWGYVRVSAKVFDASVLA